CAAADAADGTGPSAAPHAIEVSVEDDGPGVAPEDRERIFEPWVRGGGSVAASAPTERTAARERTGRGLGLGLAICRRIVEGHGGRLALRSEPGAGACFTFTLPAALPKEP
ncbi:MAG: HAMP domain-containing histidine kinase, partial [Myxococcales bacterium]|nr:HAMP domain-containing histidine kinase [Myxococcales bacterium]